MNSKLKFVGLHAHSTAGSPFDAIGYPQESMEFAFSNGMDALALTDHGNMNGLSYQVLHAKKMKKEGKHFKPIYGVEAYFHPSISDWKETKKRLEEEKKAKKAAKDDDVSGAVMEDETTTKSKNNDPIKKRNHLILLAKNQIGLNNIFSLISKSFGEGYFYKFPRMDYHLLSQHSEGIIAASACLGGVYAGDYWDNYGNEEAILNAMRLTTNKMISVLGIDNWLGELQWIDHKDQMELNTYVIKIAKEFGIKLISTCDSHYPNPEVWQNRAMYKKLNPNFISKEMENPVLPSSIDEVGYELYPKNGNQMFESYQKYSSKLGYTFDDDVVIESIENTYHIAHSQIEAFEPDNTVRLPDFVVPEGKTDDEALRELCQFELAKMGLGDGDDEGSATYVDQLNYELKVVADRGFSKYFLTMKQISDMAQDVVLTGPGRGSGAGALISYVLGITQIDPLKWNLSFARFLRSDATDYPDIDYDVSDNSVVKEKLIDAWGSNRVVSISNWNTLQPRSLLSDLSKFFGIPFNEVKEVTKIMEEEAKSKKKEELGIKFGAINVDFDDLKKYSDSFNNFLAQHPQILEHLNVLYGQVKSCSRHAGGVVIGEDLDKYMPLIKSGKVIQTPWSEGQRVRHLEPLGFIKFDLLGLKTLQMFEDCIELILKRHHGFNEVTFSDIKSFYEKNLHPNIIDIEDQKVYENIFHEGNWCGIFQFDASDGMQNFAKQAKPTNIIDITAITSIWRPGPMEAKVPDAYVRAKLDPSTVTFSNQYIKKTTEETYGFLIFQEQIAALACAVGKNITQDEGNLLRKVLTKKGTGKAAEVSQKIHDKFIEGALEKNLSEQEGEDMWKLMKNFAAYGFNKSHALSYSFISYQCAYLFTYYPDEWVCAFMNQEGTEAKKVHGISVIRSMGYNIAPVDIDKSGIKWEPHPTEPKTIVQPLNTLKGMGDAAMKKIIKNRPFKDIDEMLFDKERKLGKKELNCLIKIGALDDFIDERFDHRKHFWEVCVENKPLSKKKFGENLVNLSGKPDFTKEEIIQGFLEITGSFPFELVINAKTEYKIKRLGAPPISQFDPEIGYAWFIPTSIVTRQTKRGSNFWIVNTIDTAGGASFKCWNVSSKDTLYPNMVYVGEFKKDQYGLSTNGISNLRMLG